MVIVIVQRLQNCFLELANHWIRVARMFNKSTLPSKEGRKETKYVR